MRSRLRVSDLQEHLNIRYGQVVQSDRRCHIHTYTLVQLTAVPS
jgi:hypothetical protein